MIKIMKKANDRYTIVKVSEDDEILYDYKEEIESLNEAQDLARAIRKHNGSLSGAEEQAYEDYKWFKLRNDGMANQLNMFLLLIFLILVIRLMGWL